MRTGAGSDLLISILEKLNFFRLTGVSIKFIYGFRKKLVVYYRQRYCMTVNEWKIVITCKENVNRAFDKKYLTEQLEQIWYSLTMRNGRML